jgi:hypothetical protein
MINTLHGPSKLVFDRAEFKDATRKAAPSTNTIRWRAHNTIAGMLLSNSCAPGWCQIDLKRAYAERWLRLALILINIAWLLFGIDPWPCARLSTKLWGN